MTEIILHRTGSGQPLLMLHAFPLSARMWDKQVAAFSKDCVLWAPDYPGFGDSPAYRFDSLDFLATQLVTLLRTRGVHQAAIVGCSMGGYLAFAILRIAPQFCTKLALINTKASADSDQARYNRLMLAERVDREGCAFLAGEWHLGALSPVTLRRRPEVVNEVQRLVRAATPVGVSWAQRAMAARPDSTNLLPGIDLPAIIIHGLDDTYVSELEAREMAARIKGATFVGVEQAGHLPSMEQPALVTEALQGFISGSNS